MAGKEASERASKQVSQVWQFNQTTNKSARTKEPLRYLQKTNSNLQQFLLLLVHCSATMRRNDTYRFIITENFKVLRPVLYRDGSFCFVSEVSVSLVFLI